jgi:N-acetylmuramoyl-L-alanine amidase
MEIKEWRSLAIQSVALFFIVFSCCVCFAGRMQENPETTVLAERRTPEPSASSQAEQQEQEEIQAAESVTKSEIESMSDTYIRIPKEGIGQVSEVYIHNEYMESKIQVTFRGIATGSITKDSVLRIHGFRVSKGRVDEKKDTLLKKLVVNDQKNSLVDKNTIQIDMVTEKLFEPTLYEAEDAYYISLVEPKKAFEKIVVIDAGHGGMDEGTSSQDGRHVEKDYTLLVIKNLQKLLEKEDIKVYYTRMEDKEVSKKDRTKLANRLQADVFISVHCNASTVGERTAHGMETLYSKRKNGKKELTNKRLAEIMLKNIGEETGLRMRGTIERKNLYLLNHAEVPSVIVEIAYMSNKNDLKYIMKESGRQKIAQGIFDGVMQALEEE